MSNARNLSMLPQLGAGNSSIMKNRIINGAMVIDQRNAGASVTPTADNTYTLDRWKAYLSASSKFSVQQSSTAPAGFKNSLLVTSLAATSVGGGDFYGVVQSIEGYNIADLGWGTADAKTVTISFWVRSSLTGTFGAALTSNQDNDCYPFTYTISAANTWEQKSVTIVGPTTGTWLSTNGIGVNLIVGLGIGSGYSGTVGTWTGNTFRRGVSSAVSVVGTSGATFYITGVQLEVGSSATGFEYRQYQQELALCQRYLPYWGSDAQWLSFYNSSTGIIGVVPTPVPTRAPVTGLVFSTASALGAYNGITGGFTPTNQNINSGSCNHVTVQCNYTGLTTNQSGTLYLTSGKYMYGTGCEL